MSKLLHQRRVGNPQRVSKYTTEIWEQFDFTGIRYPTPFTDIKIFERNNSASVNVYGLEKDQRDQYYVYPIRISENLIVNRHFDLLYIQEETSNEVKGHYCFITDLARLVVGQITSDGRRIFVCRRCLIHFGRQDLLDSHEPLCSSRDPIRSRMPRDDKLVCSFKNYQFKQHIPYVVYADFECALESISSAQRDPNADISFTDKKHRHVPTSYCYYIVCNNESDTTQYQPKLYQGENAVRHFWDSLREDIRNIDRIYRNIAPMNEAEMFNLINNNNDIFCHVCGYRPPSDIPNPMVIDHCHLTGRVRGWACNECNINYQLPKFVPIIFHNGSHYDFKFIVSEIYTEPADESNFTDGRRRRRGNQNGGPRRQRARNEFVLDEADASEEESEEEFQEDEEREIDLVLGNEGFEEGEGHDPAVNIGRRRPRGIKVIAQNCENFISFEVPITDWLSARFIDSYRFLQSSLGGLASNLTDAQMQHTHCFFPGGLFALARRKGVFPYEFVKSQANYNATELPRIEEFYSSLNDEGISEADYQHAKRVWDAFNCSNLGDYSDLYLKMDVILLADIFENFRRFSLDVYQLDPAWVYSAPGLAWNAMLKMTGVRMELFDDYEKYLFCEAGIRGGYCCASERYAKANIPSTADYDENNDPSYLFYIDANNLYGHAMSRTLPLNQFRWLDQQEIADLDVLAIPEEGDDGYFLEVDLEYPENLHDEHNELPFCPEPLKTTANKNAPRKLIGTIRKITSCTIDTSNRLYEMD